MRAKRGEVVLVDYPYSDRTGSKVRPCLVVQTDRNNQRLQDIIVVMITSRTHLAGSEPTQLLIDVSTPDGQQSGLLFNSAVQRENVLTIDTSFIRRRLGTLTTSTMQQVGDCLKSALDIA